VTIILPLVQQYLPSHKQPVHALEKQGAEWEHRGILPRDERLAPVSGREAATASSGNVDLTPSRPRRMLSNKSKTIPTIRNWRVSNLHDSSRAGSDVTKS
jgi:hypothetical protein